MGKTKRGKGTKWRVVVDGHGVPLGVRLYSASPPEVRLAEETLATIRVASARHRSSRPSLTIVSRRGRMRLQAALIVSEDGVVIERPRCVACDECRRACPSGALRMGGRRVIVTEVLDEVARDSIFYEDNAAILKNARLAPTLGIKMMIRVPVIPGFDELQPLSLWVRIGG